MQVTQYSDDKKITWYKLLMRHIQVSDLATPTCLSGTVRALYLLQLPILARKGNCSFAHEKCTNLFFYHYIAD